MKQAVCLVPLISLGLAWTTAHVSAETINVFAAASLTDSLKEIALAYEKQTGDKPVFNFGASSFLARQVEEGAPADIFFSADEVKMDNLEKKGLLEGGTRISRLSNSLVVVIEADSTLRINSARDLADPKIKRIALADPKTVPAGIYAKEFLIHARLWPVVESKVIPTDNVRAALAAVESGNVDAGMVYKTDAAISKRIKVVYEVLAKEGPAISYPIAAIKGSKHLEASKRFLKFLNSNDAGHVFERFGFVVKK